MSKKKYKQSFFHFPISWIPVLGLGFFLGIASQRIPALQSYTKQAVKKVESRIDFSSVPHASNWQSPANKEPVSFFYIHRPAYSLIYDASHRNPQWVYERLTAENIQGEASRSHSEFKEDDSVPTHLRATLLDYKGSKLDRGHMAPAADHKSSPAAMSDTFYMTNMCPQCPELNRGYWAKLEKHVRDLTKHNNCVHVITGPLYLPHVESDGKRYVKYQVIGKNDIAVPTHFFKVIHLEDKNGFCTTQAYIFPNTQIQSNASLDAFQTNVKAVERAAGIVFSVTNR
jgi:endonuclease G